MKRTTGFTHRPPSSPADRPRRAPGAPRSAGDERSAAASPSPIPAAPRLGDLDITAALRERELGQTRSAPPSDTPVATPPRRLGDTPRRRASAGAGSDRRSPGARAARPALSRTGGRVRLDGSAATGARARTRPIPVAPRYRRNQRPVNWAGLFLTLLLVGGALGGGVYALTTPKLALRDVAFAGVAPADQERMGALLPGDPYGQNLIAYAALHRRSIERRLAGAAPDIAAVHVGLRWPHTLTVTVERRAPYALLAVGPNGADGEWVLDARGVPILDGHTRRLAGLPRIVVAGAGDPPASAGATPTPNQVNAPYADGAAHPGFPGFVAPSAVAAPRAIAAPPVVLGQRLTGDLALRADEAMALLRALPSAPAIRPVASIEVDKSYDLGLNMSHSLRVKLGQPSQLDVKLALVNSLLLQHPEIAASARYIDVSYPPRPAMMPRALPPAAEAASAAG